MLWMILVPAMVSFFTTGLYLIVKASRRRRRIARPIDGRRLTESIPPAPPPPYSGSAGAQPWPSKPVNGRRGHGEDVTGIEREMSSNSPAVRSAGGRQDADVERADDSCTVAAQCASVSLASAQPTPVEEIERRLGTVVSPLSTVGLVSINGVVVEAELRAGLEEPAIGATVAVERKHGRYVVVEYPRGDR